MKKLNTFIEDKQLEIEIGKDNMLVDGNSIEFMSKNKSGYILRFNDEIVEVDDLINLEEEGIFRVEIQGYTIDVKVEDPVMAALGGGEASTGEIFSPMAGEVSKVNVTVGDRVEEGKTLLVISAMKMEQKIISPVTGIVSSVNVENNGSVKAGALLIDIEPEE